jgi:hypothetical protein
MLFFSLGIRQDRVTSLCLGCSILTTSAPNSEKKDPTVGPAKTVDKSMTFKSENMESKLNQFAVESMIAQKKVKNADSHGMISIQIK